MPRYCSYFNCSNADNKKAMFRFPVGDKVRLRQWIQNSGNIRLKYMKPGELHERRMCDAHFDQNHVIKGRKKASLTKTAIPHKHPYVEIDMDSYDDASPERPHIPLNVPRITYKSKFSMDHTRTFTERINDCSSIYSANFGDSRIPLTLPDQVDVEDEPVGWMNRDADVYGKEDQCMNQESNDTPTVHQQCSPSTAEDENHLPVDWNKKECEMLEIEVPLPPQFVSTEMPEDVNCTPMIWFKDEPDIYENDQSVKQELVIEPTVAAQIPPTPTFSTLQVDTVECHPVKTEPTSDTESPDHEATLPESYPDCSAGQLDGPAPAMKFITCEHCNLEFSNQEQLSVHGCVYTGVKPFSCHICETRFVHMSSLRRHVRSHSGIKPYTCEECGLRFLTTTHLKVHSVTHSGEKPFSCDICEAKFSRLYNLNRHKLGHAGEKPYGCMKCGRKFSRMRHLKAHILSHSGDNVRSYHCELCGMAFLSSVHLKEHMFVHNTGGEAFNCNMCNAKFTRLYNLRRHKLSHAGEKPFKCEKCDRKFSRLCHLKAHLPSHTL